MAGAILTLNAGSSSIKFALFRAGPLSELQRISHGQVERIDTKPHLAAWGASGTLLDEKDWGDSPPDFRSLVETIIAWAENHLGSDRLIAVGHRVVHGGPDHSAPEQVTPALLSDLDRLTPLAPLHVPHNIEPIRAIAAARPRLPQIVCFDTAFHRTMPEVATRLALPREYEEAGIRRYGFHGLSYEYIAGRLHVVAPALARGKTIVAHLGNGASLCAMREGKSIDTTMGFTALDGLVMGTRCGSLDPGVILYLEQERGMTAAKVEDLLYRRSGLLGVSGGIASDMRTLLASTSARAREAIELFVFHIARQIGALTSSLGGLDGLVFTAGIGEHASAIRSMVCSRLDWLGAEIDRESNARDAPVISTAGSGVEIRIVPTDEEAMIARHTLDAIGLPTAN